MKRDFEQIKREAVKLHCGKYDYSYFVYSRMVDKGKIVCPEHGIFLQSMHEHLKGQGCPKCAVKSRSEKRKYTTEKFLCKLKKVHGDRYDVSEVKYVNSTTKVVLVCPVHGRFSSRPDMLLNGCGCPECHNDMRSRLAAKTKEKFVEEVDQLYGGRYDVSDAEYVNQDTRIKVNCKEHGMFSVVPYKLLHGSHCPSCMKVERDGKRKEEMTIRFIDRGNEVHGRKYVYDKIEYVNAHTPVEIICPKHGSFMQIPSYHLDGCGCQRCALENGCSCGENEVKKFITEMVGCEVLYNNRSLLLNRELDVYVPERHVAVEYDGLFWHSEFNVPQFYHLNKTNDCMDKGVRLIHIFEDEWLYRKEMVKSRLRYVLGSSELIHSMDCTFGDVESDVADEFLEKNDIDPISTNDRCFGLFLDGNLVQLVCMNGSQIVRNTMLLNTNVEGGTERLLNEMPYESFLVMVDRRWECREEYESIGFSFLYETQPDFMYVCNDRRVKENRNGTFSKIYDCGYDFMIFRKHPSS